MTDSSSPATAVVDLDALAANVRTLREHASGAAVMAVVKADGYGHGLLPVARAALAGGATWLGTAFVAEALALRAAGLTVPVLALVAAPGQDLTSAIRAGVDLTVGTAGHLHAVAAAAERAGAPARIHLEADTGLARGGSTAEDWVGFTRSVAAAAATEAVEVVGLWSHLASADDPDSPVTARQVAAFAEMADEAGRAGLRPRVRHLANSAGVLLHPATSLDLVRPGIAVYGMSPAPAFLPASRWGLRPVMTLTARLALTKRVRAGQGVSYSHTWTAPADTTIGLVPLGYADGVPRSASGRAPVSIAGRRHVGIGRVCMDQFLVDLGPDGAPTEGDEVVLFGTGAAGEPTAEDWAAAAGTISYEILTGVGSRVTRIYSGTAGSA